MKIKAGGKVYLQNYDVSYIMQEVISYPMSIAEEVFNERDTFFVNGPVGALQFECVFEKPKNVKWLMKQDWIVDYEEYAHVPLSGLENLYNNLKAECLVSIEEFNARDGAYRDLHYDEENDRIGKLSHRIYSIGTLISAYKGQTAFILPSGYKGKIIPGTKVANPHKKKFNFFRFIHGAH